MKKIWGSILYGLAKFFDVVLGGLIKGLTWAVDAVEGVRQYLAPVLGCGFFFIILNPLTLLIFNNKVFWTILFILLLFPLLGTTFVSWLKYGHYVLTEYLYDQADYYRYGRNTKRPFSSYSSKYRRKKMQEEQEERRRAQAEQASYWDQVFKNFSQNSTYWTGGYGPYQQGPYDQTGDQTYGGGYGNYGDASGSAYSNPYDSFKKQYEEACNTLEVPYDTDEYQVKLAYRKMAKKYHPDINKAKGATEKFQKVNAAYDFLSKENIERYKSMS